MMKKLKQKRFVKFGLSSYNPFSRVEEKFAAHLLAGADNALQCAHKSLSNANRAIEEYLAEKK